MSNHAPAFTRSIGLIIEPLDTLFFRDGRPFGAGDFARGGLPMPQTLYGMIHRYIQSRLGIVGSKRHDQRNNNGPHAWERWVAVRGPWLARTKEGAPAVIEDVYVPPPAHLLKKGKEKDAPMVLLSPFGPDTSFPGWQPPEWNGQADLTPLFYTGDAEKLESVGGLLKRKGLESVLRGKVPTCDDMIRGDAIAKEIYAEEPRTGIAIQQSTGTVEHGFLYTARHIRLADGIVFYAELGMETGHADHHEKLAALFHDGVVLPFGGEGRRVLARTAKGGYTWPAPPEIPGHDEGGFSTILITPAILNGRDDSSSQPWHPPHLATLRAAAVGKPVSVSGWSLGDYDEKGGDLPASPKPTRHAVAAGTTYFWQNGKHADPDKQYPVMYQLSHKPLDRAAGWGVALRGVWRWNKGAV